MSLVSNIKCLKEEKGVLQKEIASIAGLDTSHYSKIKNRQREASVELLDKLSKYYGISIDQIVFMNKDIPKEITLDVKTANEQARHISELDDKDKSVVFSMIEIMLTKKKIKDYFQKMWLCFNLYSYGLKGRTV